MYTVCVCVHTRLPALFIIKQVHSPPTNQVRFVWVGAQPSCDLAINRRGSRQHASQPASQPRAQAGQAKSRPSLAGWQCGMYVCVVAHGQANCTVINDGQAGRQASGEEVGEGSGKAQQTDRQTDTADSLSLSACEIPCYLYRSAGIQWCPPGLALMCVSVCVCGCLACSTAL